MPETKAAEDANQEFLKKKKQNHLEKFSTIDRRNRRIQRISTIESKPTLQIVQSVVQPIKSPLKTHALKITGK